MLDLIRSLVNFKFWASFFIRIFVSSFNSIDFIYIHYYYIFYFHPFYSKIYKEYIFQNVKDIVKYHYYY
jgi:hypothetical protein